MENINDYMPLSSDLNKERLETLKKLFPDLFTNEGKLNIDELKKVVDPKSVSETLLDQIFFFFIFRFCLNELKR